MIKYLKSCFILRHVSLLSKAKMFLTTHFYLLKIRGLIELRTEHKKLHFKVGKLSNFTKVNLPTFEEAFINIGKWFS